MLNLFKFINKGTRMMSNAIYICHQCKIESIQTENIYSHVTNDTTDTTFLLTPISQIVWFKVLLS